MKINSYLFVLIFAPILAWSSETEIKIPGNIPYQDESTIQDNVIAQCKSLGSNFSEHIAKALEANEYVPTKMDILDTSQGVVFDIKISNVFSRGNAFIGHMKSVTAVVKVYKDGKLATSKTFMRDTGGGFAGGFKGSCSVLDRATTAIGNDIAQWYKKQY